MPRTALVTGGRGFVGRHIVAALRRAGYATFTVGQARPGDDARHRAIAGLDDLQGLVRVLQSVRPALVVHLAAAAPPDADDEHRRVTVTGTRTLISALAAAAPRSLLLAMGSAAEFGPGLPQTGLVADEQPCAPASPYGRAKHEASRLVLRYREDGGRATVLRLFTAVGVGAPAHSLLGSLVAQLRAMPPGGGVLRVHGPERERDYLGVEDVAALSVALAELGSMLPPVMNLCSGQAMTVGAWITALAAARGIPVRVEHAAQGPRMADPHRVVGDPATLLRLGVPPKPVQLHRLAAEIMAPCRG